MFLFKCWFVCECLLCPHVCSQVLGGLWACNIVALFVLLFLHLSDPKGLHSDIKLTAVILEVSHKCAKQ